MGSLLQWALIFLVVAIVAAFFGFGGVAGTAMGGAQMPSSPIRSSSAKSRSARSASAP